MIPVTICLCRRLTPDDQTVGRQTSFSRFENFENIGRTAKIIAQAARRLLASMGKQSQIIIFWVVSGRADLWRFSALPDETASTF